MNKPSANLMIAIFDKVVCIKVLGRANFTCSLDLKKAVSELSQRGYGQFVLDLSECIIMDSTFLGLLAGLGLQFAKADGGVDRCPVELLNPNERIADLLENLGVSHLFKITHGAEMTPENFKLVTAEGGEASRTEVTRACLEAHQTLMNLNPENVRKFKDVAQFLSEDLKKLEGEKLDV